MGALVELSLEQIAETLKKLTPEWTNQNFYFKKMKSIRFSNHARIQMELRGASQEDVIKAIELGKWEPAKMGKSQSKYTYDFNKATLTNQKFYKYKIVEPIFADERDEIVVITVKVYYSNQEARQ